MTALIILAALYVIFIVVAVFVANLAFIQARRVETEWWYRSAMYIISVLYVLGGAFFVFQLVSELVNYAQA